MTAYTDLLRKPVTTTDTAKPWDFVPVIFANGRDDDLPGLTAAFKSEKVQYGDKIYQPGEALTIDSKTLLLDCSHIVVVGEATGDCHIPPNTGGDYGAVIHARGDRQIEINNCNLMFMKPFTWRI